MAKKKVKIIEVPSTPDKVYTEYGVMFPDGHIQWEYEGTYGLSGELRTEAGQEDFAKRYEERLGFAHVSGDRGQVRFVKRTVTKSFSVPVTHRGLRRNEEDRDPRE